MVSVLVDILQYIHIVIVASGFSHLVTRPWKRCSNETYGKTGQPTSRHVRSFEITSHIFFGFSMDTFRSTGYVRTTGSVALSLCAEKFA